MKYYYLNGIDKLGPYTLEEIISRNLNSVTMIFREDKSNWVPLSEFEELNVSPVDILDNSEQETTVVELINKNPIEEKKIKLPKYTIQILLIALSIGLSALITYFQQQNDYNKISAEINSIFDGKTEVSDYYIRSGLDGKLYDVVYHTGIKLSDFKLPDYVTANNIILNSAPIKSLNDKDYWFEDNLKRWEIFKNLKQCYIKKEYIDVFNTL